MTAPASLTFTAETHAEVQRHLFPGDGLEAAAILVCSRTPGPRMRLLVREVLLVPHAACKREADRLVWPGKSIEDAIDRADADGDSLLLIHSHPAGLYEFSSADDASDAVTMRGLFAALDGPHGSAIMVPSGAVLARTYDADLAMQDIELVAVPGHDLRYWWSNGLPSSRPLAFTTAMTHELGRLSACVVGVSGTGSIVAEQVARLGFHEIVLIDFDRLEPHNLNRILNSTLAGATSGELKVFAFADAIATYRGPGVARSVPERISARGAVVAASQCDVIFSCVDTLEARNIADLVSSAFLIPLLDVGVSIPTRRTPGGAAIADACGRIDYVRPGGPTLADRKVYTPESLRAEYLRTVAPDDHGEELRAGYLKGVAEEAPAVISLNMRAASACVLEFLARAFPFRHDSNENFARTEFSIAAGEEDFLRESAFSHNLNGTLARGAKEPLLGLPALRTQTIGT
ncbi:ThiF family adenylyltransferase [Paraburkholderia sp. SEWSISQ10-3 4]|uniref:ThiF family adenylyltransferase n=1 Tax=Paraburkholderia TaxID=1822464 RepID=UPI002251BC63|nr:MULTISPECIES: ThiF family adenylyltransferase [Paraburkholderia]MCX4141122.1 ThiF family adenylyltransferase [Paraburkholderia aspalathi]MDN7173805.1 ThiF family adenylyltransferase [Paraburkholderia sp. SEWSISQ10-3 4]MDQ6503446.1 ThiF family adenylyltransferase [Paraburkholderia aspalathi]